VVFALPIDIGFLELWHVSSGPEYGSLSTSILDDRRHDDVDFGWEYCVSNLPPTHCLVPLPLGTDPLSNQRISQVSA
jgi:hypothetical protein